MGLISQSRIKGISLFVRNNAKTLTVNCCKDVLPLRHGVHKMYNISRRGYSGNHGGAGTTGFESHTKSIREGLTCENSPADPSKLKQTLHKPVMVDEVVDVINPKPGQVTNELHYYGFDNFYIF